MRETFRRLVSEAVLGGIAGAFAGYFIASTYISVADKLFHWSHEVMMVSIQMCVATPAPFIGAITGALAGKANKPWAALKIGIITGVVATVLFSIPILWGPSPLEEILLAAVPNLLTGLLMGMFFEARLGAPLEGAEA